MPTPTAVLNARERLIKSIEHWSRTIHDGTAAGGPQIAAAVAADLFGDPAPDISPVPGRPSDHIGPVAELSLWFALYCEEWGIMNRSDAMPAGIMIDPKLLIPLLALHPQPFSEELYHKIDIGIDDAKVICKHCKLMVVEHFEAIEKLHMAEIEGLQGDIEVLEATTDIQMQAITKQTEAIEALTEESGVITQDNCPHPEWLSTVGFSRCTRCGKFANEVDGE